MILPTDYTKLTQRERKLVREAYAKLQGGKCIHCGEPLNKEASKEVLKKEIDKKLFPIFFFKYPVHLHHCHNSRMTIGTVHCHCNAVLYQYHNQ